jgi:cardiolipin synthase
MNNSERSTPRRPAWRTIPNLVTVLRIALVAPIVALLLSGAQPLGAAALAAVFGATTGSTDGSPADCAR